MGSTLMNTLLQALYLPDLFKMARKSIKKEPVAQEGIPDAHSTPACEQSQQFQLSSSGDTVVDTVVDTDVVMHEDLGQNRCINFEANGIPETSTLSFSTRTSRC